MKTKTVFIDNNGRYHDKKRDCEIANMSEAEKLLGNFIARLNRMDYRKKVVSIPFISDYGNYMLYNFADLPHLVYKHYFKLEKFESEYEFNMNNLMQLQLLALMDLKEEWHYIRKKLREQEQENMARYHKKQQLFHKLDMVMQIKSADVNNEELIKSAIDELKEFYKNK